MILPEWQDQFYSNWLIFRTAGAGGGGGGEGGGLQPPGMYAHIFNQPIEIG